MLRPNSLDLLLVSSTHSNDGAHYSSSILHSKALLELVRHKGLYGRIFSEMSEHEISNLVQSQNLLDKEVLCELETRNQQGAGRLLINLKSSDYEGTQKAQAMPGVSHIYVIHYAKLKERKELLDKMFFEKWGMR